MAEHDSNERDTSVQRVEAVAKAIHAAHMKELGPLRAWPWEGASKDYYDRLARAAIAGFTAGEGAGRG